MESRYLSETPAGAAVKMIAYDLVYRGLGLRALKYGVLGRNPTDRLVPTAWSPANPGGKWVYTDPKSQQELMDYNTWVVEDVIYRPAGELMQYIITQGEDPLADPRPALYRGLTSNDSDKVAETMRSIISLYANNWHRAEQMKWYLDKIDQIEEIAKDENKIHQLKLLLMLYFAELHTVNTELADFLKRLLALVVGK